MHFPRQQTEIAESVIWLVYRSPYFPENSPIQLQSHFADKNSHRELNQRAPCHQASAISTKQTRLRHRTAIILIMIMQIMRHCPQPQHLQAFMRQNAPKITPYPAAASANQCQAAGFHFLFPGCLFGNFPEASPNVSRASIDQQHPGFKRKSHTRSWTIR